MQTLAVKALGIKKVFKMASRELEVLKGIDLSIEKGQIMSIIGSSGSGKSTLMNILGCLDTPTEGQYWIGGDEVQAMEPDKLALLRAKKIGFVFQRFNLLPDLSALENVVIPQLYLSVHREEAERRARDLLNLVGLTSWKGHFPYQMSGGQQQRVAIARALSNDPEIVFADEPTGSLDSQTGDMVIDLFKELNAKHGLTLVLVTHDPKVAKVADRVVKMVDGQLVKQ